MAIEIIVPTLGESVSDATVARWIKTTGDIVAAEGSVVEVGAILARLEEGVGGAPAKQAKNVAKTPAEKPAQKSVPNREFCKTPNASTSRPSVEKSGGDIKKTKGSSRGVDR